MSIPTEDIRSEYYCISFINTMRSPEDIQESDAIRKYYSIVLNTIAVIARSFDAKIVKNIGDGLVCYFPKTSDSTDDAAFKDVIECGQTVIAARHIINAKLREEGLPSVDYRISTDYGKVEVARSITPPDNDLFGSPMNLCYKINTKAPANEMVIGDNLYQNFRRLSSSGSFHFTDQYTFKQAGEYRWVGGNEGRRVSTSDKNYQNNPYKIYTIDMSNSKEDKNDVLDPQRFQQYQQEQEYKNNNNISG